MIDKNIWNNRESNDSPRIIFVDEELSQPFPPPIETKKLHKRWNKKADKAKQIKLEIERKDRQLDQETTRRPSKTIRKLRAKSRRAL